LNPSSVLPTPDRALEIALDERLSAAISLLHDISDRIPDVDRRPTRYNGTNAPRMGRRWKPTEMSKPRANAESNRPSQIPVVDAPKAVANGLRANVSVSSRVQHPVRNEKEATARSDHAWLEQVIKADGPGILRMLWRLLGREQDVLDAYQDCFCKLTACRDRSDLANVRAYAYRTATNIAIELIRTRKRQSAHREALATKQGQTDRDPEVARDRATAVKLREAIGELPTHLRNVVVLRDLSRMSYSDVGRTLGIEPATARVYRRHAVVKLTELLGVENPK
jgi:RNA polymerase sigma-70 factor (ECF subfamily)